MTTHPDDSFSPPVGEWYPPSPDMLNSALIKNYEQIYHESLTDVEAFWAKQAEKLDWFEPWTQVVDRSNAPFYRWYVNAKTNIAYNALDRHVKTWRKNKLALIFEGEPGDKQTYSYHKLYREVNKFANVLKSMGVKKGDRVTVYMGRIPELIMAMLACAKIGAVHSVVYGGFSEHALADRIEDAQSRVVITCDGAWLRGYISVAFHCPYSGAVSPEAVRPIVDRLLEMGCAEISLADTTGRATPDSVAHLLAALSGQVPVDAVALHLHDTSGTALDNVDVGLAAGVRVFDSAAGGLGGCPFAPGAPGNLATESLVAHLQSKGYHTGIDPEKLRAATAIVMPLVRPEPVR